MEKAEIYRFETRDLFETFIAQTAFDFKGNYWEKFKENTCVRITKDGRAGILDYTFITRMVSHTEVHAYQAPTNQPAKQYA